MCRGSPGRDGALAPVPLLASFSIELRAACLTAVAITGLGALAHLLPVTPAALGTYHLLCACGFLAMNPHLDWDQAVAFALVAHLIGTLTPALPGLLFLPTARAKRP